MDYSKEPEFAQTVLRQRRIGWLYTSGGRSGGGRESGSGRGRGKGRMGGFATEPEGSCVCPRCGCIHLQ